MGVDKYDRATEILELCTWIYQQVSDVRNIINRLSEYCITDLVIDDTHTSLTKDEEDTLLRALEVMGLKSKLIDAAKQYFATGNVFCSVETRFKKQLKCPKCGLLVPLTSMDATYDVTKLKFKAKCISKKCNYSGYFEEIDQKLRRPEDIFIRLWDFHEIEFTYNPISDEYKYYHKIPRSFTEKLVKGRPDTFLVQTTPKEILEEIFSKGGNRIVTNPVKDKLVGFGAGKIKHIKRPSTISSIMEGWGEPITVGVIQDSFFMMLLRQAQATLLTDYIVPIRIVSPDPSVKDLMDMSEFPRLFDGVYESFQKDPMQIMKFPYPIQYQTLSGEAKQFFLSNEIDYTRQAIRRGIGLPSELLDGGMQNFSAGSISLRMLENFFLNFTKNIVIDLVNNFIIPRVCVILDIPPFRVEMSKFKMIDDVNQKQAILDLFDRNLVPDTQIYDQYSISRPSDKELNESVQRKGQRDKIYQVEIAEAQAEGASLLAERQMSDQMKMQDMQTKNNELQAAKQTEESQDPNLAGEGQMQGNQSPTLSPDGSQLPSPDELANNVVGQLQTPEEINNFLELLNKRVNDPKYIGDVKNAIQHVLRANQIEKAQSQAQDQMGQIQQQTQSKNKGNNGGKKQPPPEQKPQTRSNPV